MDEASTSASGGAATRRASSPARSGVYHRFTQQNLPAWKPAMTPGCVAEINRRYDVECVPNAYRGNKQAYIKDSAISKNCTLEVKLSEQEDLIVWMRTSALPKFRKLYGVIEEDLEVDETINILIRNNYNTYTIDEHLHVNSLCSDPCEVPKAAR
nr:unnamed protein product [Digitaria exilis]